VCVSVLNMFATEVDHVCTLCDKFVVLVIDISYM